MSLTNKATIICPECGTSQDVSWAGSVYAERHPALRDAILDGTFQSESCSVCEAKLRLPSHMAYLDLDRGHWMLAEDIKELPNWEKHETKARNLFDDAFGSRAPKPAQDLAKGVEPRLVFGWQGLREKLICTELSLDDVTIELMKLALIRGAHGAELGGNIAIRLVSGYDENLQFNITDNQTEDILSTTEVPRSLYDDIAGDEASWSPLREQLSGKTFADIARLMIGD